MVARGSLKPCVLVRTQLAVPYARLLQLEERTVLEIVKCGFKSHVGYQIGLEVDCTQKWVMVLVP